MISSPTKQSLSHFALHFSTHSSVFFDMFVSLVSIVTLALSVVAMPAHQPKWIYLSLLYLLWRAHGHFKGPLEVLLSCA
jgi:hypothetical protein